MSEKPFHTHIFHTRVDTTADFAIIPACFDGVSKCNICNFDVAYCMTTLTNYNMLLSNASDNKNENKHMSICKWCLRLRSTTHPKYATYVANSEIFKHLPDVINNIAVNYFNEYTEN
jgi:hypothetical protein